MPEPGLDPMLPAPFEVVRRRRETIDTVTLSLQPLSGRASASPIAGQFDMLYAFGVGEVPISVSGRAVRSHALEHTIRAVGAVTRALCNLRTGAQLGLRGPFGRPWPLDRFLGCDLVLVAGGIGLAPLRPVVHAVHRRRSAFGRLSILYGARTPGELLFSRELERWAKSQDTSVQVTVDRVGEHDWKGPVGTVARLLARVPLDPPRTGVFVCGPEVMLEPCARQLELRGLASDRMYVSLERNMHCAIRACGHCQLGPRFVCRDGPVLPFSAAADLLRVAEL